MPPSYVGIFDADRLDARDRFHDSFALIIVAWAVIPYNQDFQHLILAGRSASE